MNNINLSSGDMDPNNDHFKLSIVMEAGASSSIYVYEEGGSGFLQYNTRSDVVTKFCRKKEISQNTGQLSSSQNGRIGYPDYFTWIPGQYIAYNTNQYLNGSGHSIDPSTLKTDLTGSGYYKSNKINLNAVYPSGWTPSRYLYIYCTNNEGGSYNPFLTLKKSNLSGSTGIIEITSSSLKGSFFDLGIRSQPDSGILVPASGSTEEFGIIKSTQITANSVLQEWNSIFSINDNCNAFSTFSNQKNRDEAFFEEMYSYVSENWYDKLKTYLWGDIINDQSIQLSSRDPETLKNIILYCFNYYGASDDILSLGKNKYPGDPLVANSTLIRWHIGLRGFDIYTNSQRMLDTELVYIPLIDKYKEITEVVGLPPKTSYINNIVNNINMTGSIGTSSSSSSSSSSSY